MLFGIYFVSAKHKYTIVCLLTKTYCRPLYARHRRQLIFIKKTKHYKYVYLQSARMNVSTESVCECAFDTKETNKQKKWLASCLVPVIYSLINTPFTFSCLLSSLVVMFISICCVTFFVVVVVVLV